MKSNEKEVYMNLRLATEKELREYRLPHVHSIWRLLFIVWQLTRRQHDYGTCVYAMSIAATAAFYYVAHQLGVTGFQASCADMDILSRTRNMKDGFRIFNYSDLLYPQYRDKVQEFEWETLLQENKDRLRERANVLLIESPNAHPHVRAHWERLAQA